MIMSRRLIEDGIVLILNFASILSTCDAEGRFDMYKKSWCCFNTNMIFIDSLEDEVNVIFEQNQSLKRKGKPLSSEKSTTAIHIC